MSEQPTTPAKEISTPKEKSWMQRNVGWHLLFIVGIISLGHAVGHWMEPTTIDAEVCDVSPFLDSLKEESNRSYVGFIKRKYWNARHELATKVNEGEVDFELSFHDVTGKSSYSNSKAYRCKVLEDVVRLFRKDGVNADTTFRCYGIDFELE